MPLFALLLCLNNTYAWYVDDNNNMSSSNLIDNANFANVGNSNGVASETGKTTIIYQIKFKQTILFINCP